MNRQKKEQQRRFNMKDNCVTTKTITTTNEIGSLSTTFTPTPYNILANFIPQTTIAGSEVNKQEKKMYINNDPARERLHSRAIDAHREHSDTLRQIYFINDHDATMWSVEDAIKAIKDGKFVYRRPDDAKKPKSYYYNGFDIRFRDPDHPEDHEGFAKATETLDEHYETVLDHIVVSDTKDALKKVDSFREHKFH